MHECPRPTAKSHIFIGMDSSSWTSALITFHFEMVLLRSHRALPCQIIKTKPIKPSGSEGKGEEVRGPEKEKGSKGKRRRMER